jgi:hypothetical protein
MSAAKRFLLVPVLIGVVALVLSGCSTQARAERKGKEFGEQVCKIKSSDSSNEAQRHLRKADDKLHDLARFVGRDVRQDVRPLDRNLDQLVRDVSRGGNIRQQDVNAIVRNVEQAKSSASGATQAAYDGMLEGLNDCN